MQNNLGLNREGDVNLSQNREKWINTLDDKSKYVLKADESVFMKQAMSTPCMNVVVNAEGCFIEDMSGKKYSNWLNSRFKWSC